jgi:hypothetical protein
MLVGHRFGPRLGQERLRRDRPARFRAGVPHEGDSQLVRRDEVLRDHRVTGGYADALVAEVGVGHDRRDHVGLVDRADELDVAQDREHVLHIAGEQVDGMGIRPADVTGEPGRIGEVVEGHHGGESGIPRGIDHAAVVVELGARDETRFRLDASPLDTEAIGVEPRLREQPHVFGIAVVAVCRVATGLFDRAPRGATVFGLPPVARGVVALDLVGGRRGTPEKAVGKASHLIPVSAMPCTK